MKEDDERFNKEGPPAAGTDSHAHEPRERRSEHRVGDDQRTGQGVLTAVSRLNMLERRKKMWRAVRGQPGPEVPRA